MWFHLVLASGNSKTGPIPVSTTSAESCPDACPLKKAGCYAEGGPLWMHWKKVTAGEKGTTWQRFLALIRDLPRGTLWRHNQAGDLPGVGDQIDAEMLQELTVANKGRRGFTFTHKPVGEGHAANTQAVAAAVAAGFMVNLSADNLAEADELADLGIAPVVVVLPAEAEGPLLTAQGRTVVICPAQTTRNVTCARCQLCAKDRKAIVGFRAHGSRKRVAERSTGTLGG